MKYIISSIIIYIAFLIILIRATKNRNKDITDDEYEEFISYIDKYKNNKKK